MSILTDQESSQHFSVFTHHQVSSLFFQILHSQTLRDHKQRTIPPCYLLYLIIFNLITKHNKLGLLKFERQCKELSTRANMTFPVFCVFYVGFELRQSNLRTHGLTHCALLSIQSRLTKRIHHITNLIEVLNAHSTPRSSCSPVLTQRVLLRNQ